MCILNDDVNAFNVWVNPVFDLIIYRIVGYTIRYEIYDIMFVF